MPKTLAKHEVIARDLRQRIIAGAFTPGARLPTRTDIERDFQASMPTVQRAIDLLIRDGFVRSRHGTGTFVTERPPHLSHYGIVFPAHWRSRFYGALHEVAQSTVGAQGIRLTEYIHHDEAGNERLMADVAAHRLAGLIFVHPQWDIWDSPAMTEPGIPRVLIAGEGRVPVPVVDVDMPSFFVRALDYLQARGRKRIALLFPDTGTLDPDMFANMLRERGLETRPYWLAATGAQMTPRSVAGVTRLLMELEGDKRPDALVIEDDNLVDLAAGGLMSSGVRLPDELEVVAHCNFPLPVSSGALPIQRLGFDCNQIMRTAVQCLAKQSRGETCAPLTRVEAVFEEEWTRQNSASARSSATTPAAAGVRTTREGMVN